MKKETILTFSLGVIVGAAGMWALTPEQTTFEEGVIEYAPATTGEQVETPTPSDNGMAPSDNNMQNDAPVDTTSSNEAPAAAPTTSSNEAPAATPATSSNEAPAQEAAAEAAPAPLSHNEQEEQREEEAKLASANIQASDKECKGETACDEEQKAS